MQYGLDRGKHVRYLCVCTPNKLYTYVRVIDMLCGHPKRLVLPVMFWSIR